MRIFSPEQCRYSHEYHQPHILFDRGPLSFSYRLHLFLRCHFALFSLFFSFFAQPRLRHDVLDTRSFLSILFQSSLQIVLKVQFPPQSLVLTKVFVFQSLFFAGSHPPPLWHRLPTITSPHTKVLYFFYHLVNISFYHSHPLFTPSHTSHIHTSKHLHHEVLFCGGSRPPRH